MTNEYFIHKAHKRVKAKKRWMIHLSVYGILVSFLFMMNMLTSPWNWWFLYPAAALALPLAFHYLAAYGVEGIRGALWEEKEIEREMLALQEKYPEEFADSFDVDLPYETLELRKSNKSRHKASERDFV